MVDIIISKKDMLDALEKRNGKKLQNKFASKSIAICGLGGLGSNIAISLARAGVSKLVLIDFDKVDITNLNRQQYNASQVGEYKTYALEKNIKLIAPYVEIVTYTEKITENNIIKLLSNCDIICEAFDKASQKAMLVNFVLEKLPDKYLVSGSGMAGMESSNSIKTRKVLDKFYICGDEVSDIDDDIGLFASRVMICAGHQAHMILRILAEKYEV